VQELDVTWRRVASVWWLVFWRGAVGGLLLGAVAGFIVGMVVALAGHPELGRTAGGWAGRLISIPWVAVALKMALEKRYREFRIVLVPSTHGTA
jgi:hypothetical protein